MENGVYKQSPKKSKRYLQEAHTFLKIAHNNHSHAKKSRCAINKNNRNFGEKILFRGPDSEVIF
jgi:hypothetical protein